MWAATASWLAAQWLGEVLVASAAGVLEASAGMRATAALRVSRRLLPCDAERRSMALTAEGLER